MLRVFFAHERNVKGHACLHPSPIYSFAADPGTSARAPAKAEIRSDNGAPTDQGRNDSEGIQAAPGMLEHAWCDFSSELIVLPVLLRPMLSECR